ncbi:MAG: SRPBCC family protein [Actinobacteria bacterium]|nr:SRPBCC family protein [Actinomycetota bacterium]
MVVRRARVIPATSETLWAVVADVERLSEWFTFAERAERLGGTGLGRRQRIHGRWGGRGSEVDQVVTVFEPTRRLAWRHESERLDGKPAPQFARETRFSIELAPADGGTRVVLTSQQVPAAWWKGVLIWLFGARAFAGQLDRSLARLECLSVSSGSAPGA